MSEPAALPADGVPARASGGSDSTNGLIEANQAFVIRIASEYRNLGLPLEDLVNEGNIGLLEAARRFDSTRGTRFITYAVWWIRKLILRALTRGSTNVYVPEYQLKLVRRLRTTRGRLSRALGREVDREEMSRELGMGTAKIDRILQVKLQEVSIDDGAGPGREAALSRFLVDRSCRHPVDTLIYRENREMLQRALLHLTDQERTVIINRFGLGGGPAFSLSEIGIHLGVSRERVRQIEENGKRRLRRTLTGLAQPPVSARNTCVAPVASARVTSRRRRSRIHGGDDDVSERPVSSTF